MKHITKITRKEVGQNTKRHGWQITAHYEDGSTEIVRKCGNKPFEHARRFQGYSGAINWNFGMKPLSRALSEPQSHHIIEAAQ